MQAHDPLEKVDLGDETTNRPMYISEKIDLHLKAELIKVFREFRDCFAYDYDDMYGLNCELVEQK